METISPTILMYRKARPFNNNDKIFWTIKQSNFLAHLSKIVVSEIKTMTETMDPTVDLDIRVEIKKLQKKKKKNE